MDDVALVDDTFITEFKDNSLYHEAFADIENKMESGDMKIVVDDDILPQTAQDMGSGKYIYRKGGKFCKYL